MFKLKNKIIDKMINAKCSSKEIDFILYLSKHQNELGQASDIHYLDVCNELNISKQHYYNILDSLSKKEIIRTTYQNKSTWDIIICDNFFINDNDYKDSYLNTNRNFLFSNTFKNLKSNEKLLILKLLILTANNPFKIRKPNIMKWLNIKCESVLSSYLETLKKYFTIQIQHELITFTVQNNKVSLNSNSAKQQNFVNKLKRFCLKHKIAFTYKDLLDTYNLSYLYECIKNSFFDILVDVSFTYKQLQPAYINYLCQLKFE